ncbi:MAG: UvrB/UvrC motif-containing protein [Gammaproteobacteria bacterium]
MNELVEEMQVKSTHMEFEKAAEIRDQIKELKIIQSQQVVESSNSMNLDIFSITSELGIFIVTMSAVRGGLLLGHKNFFPKTPKQESTDEVLQAFISQYYQDKPIPGTIVINIKLSEKKWLETALSQVSQSSVQIISTPRGDKKKMLELNITNMNNALELHISKKANWQHKWQMWVKQLQLKNPPNRVECFDISHVFGEQTRASCVVFDMNGAKKNMYRNYKNIRHHQR